MSETLKHEFVVQMACSGCSGAVNRVLGKAKDNNGGVDSYTVNLEKQTVEVIGPIDHEKLEEMIGKTGKKIVSNACQSRHCALA